MKKHLLTTALILGLASAPVLAGSGQSFSDVDTNGDGSLSKQEAQEAGLRLEQVDANGDGQISQAEYEEVHTSSSDKTEEQSS